jgi:hypothetical protein
MLVFVAKLSVFDAKAVKLGLQKQLWQPDESGSESQI